MLASAIRTIATAITIAVFTFVARAVRIPHQPFACLTNSRSEANLGTRFMPLVNTHADAYIHTRRVYMHAWATAEKLGNEEDAHHRRRGETGETGTLHGNVWRKIGL